MSISWEKAASLLEGCRSSSATLYVESTLERVALGEFEAKISSVCVSPPRLFFVKLDSNMELPVNLIGAAFSFDETGSGAWELTVFLADGARISFSKSA